MSRQPRAKSASNIYHVVIRGSDRQIIFEDSKDYKKYIELLQLYSSELHFDIYAYCLMSNHIHLLIHTPECSTGTIFRHLSTHYAGWFNMKYSRTGHVQQGRYYSEPVEDETYKQESDATPLDIHHVMRRIPDDVAKDIIFEQTNCSNTTEFQNLPLVDRNAYIKTLHKEKGISIRQLNRLTGIPKGVIDRIVTKGHSS